MIQCTQSWLKPLYRHMKQQLLEQAVIHADETVVQVLKEDGKPATSESRMWLYASGEYSKNHIRIFEYQPDRSGKRPESFLKGFTGCLVTDGYAGYNQVAKVTHCGCWAHAIPGQIPGPRGTGKADALAPGSKAQGTHSEMNERQDPENGTLPKLIADG